MDYLCWIPYDRETLPMRIGKEDFGRYRPAPSTPLEAARRAAEREYEKKEPPPKDVIVQVEPLDNHTNDVWFIRVVIEDDPKYGRLYKGFDVTEIIRERKIDEIFSLVDDLLEQDNMEQLDQWLDTIDPESLDLSLVIAALSATLPATKRLSRRPALVQRTERYLNKTTTPERKERLLTGLR